MTMRMILRLNLLVNLLQKRISLNGTWKNNWAAGRLTATPF
jgi:hypothetical protein